ncbi:MAG: hypothetical protein R2827_07725 [Bdellovibrionales bacterium]
MTICKHAGICSGCAWIDKKYSDQLALKEKALEHLLPLDSPKPKLISVGESHLRNRLDFTLLRQPNDDLVLGLYSIVKQSIVDIEECPALAPNLEETLRVFKHDFPPVIKKGSVRLRVSPRGQRGVWLDFANNDIKALFDEKEWLTRLLVHFTVEVGQRHKRLLLEGGRLKLADPQPQPWMNTYVGPDLEEFPLYSTIAGFTQVSQEGNREIISQIRDILRESTSQNWMELFGGAGNLTLPMASWEKFVRMYEVDKISLKSLEVSLRHFEKKKISRL